MLKHTFLLLALGAMTVGQVNASGMEAARAKATDLCADCHGDNGRGDAENPPIAGMSVEKFTAAMKEYQAGTRTKSKKMIRAANKVNDEEIAGLAAYYGNMK